MLGAGCLGLSAALALASRGHDVTVVDPGGVGAGATGKAAGIVSTATWHDDDFALVQRTRAGIGGLVAEAMVEGRPEARHVWRALESITVAAQGGLGAMDDVQERLERHGEEPERLGHREAEAAFPALCFAAGEEVLAAQEDGVVEAGDLAALLAWAVQEAGATIRSGEAARPEGPRRASRTATDGAPRQAGGGRMPEARVVAAGAWSAKVLARQGVRLPLAAFRTQAASLAMPGAGEVPVVHDTVHGFYARPESADSLMAGDGTVLEPHDPDAYDEAADPAFRESLARRLPQRVRSGAQARLRTGWAGLCVATPDRHPAVGPAPGREGLFVLTGDNGFGVMRCVALGERLADAVEGDVHPVTDPARLDGAPADFPLREGFAW